MAKMTLTPEEEFNERAIKEYGEFVATRLAAGDTPYMMRDSTWAALPHVATADQLRKHGESIPVRDIREPEFEQFVQRRLAAGDKPHVIICNVTVAACDALDQAHRDGKTLTKKQKAAVLVVAASRAAAGGK